MGDQAALSFAAMVHARRSAHAAEIAEVVALLEASDAYVIDDDPQLPEPLRVKRVGSGRDGVLGPTEAFLLEAAAATGMSFGGMRERTSQALSVRVRHPRVWELFISGGVQWWVVRKIEEACQELSLEAALEVDRRASHWVSMHPVWSVLDQLSRWVMEADPDEAHRKAALSKKGRFVHVGRFEDEHVGLFGRVDAADGVLFDQALDQIAATLPAPEVPEELEPEERAWFIRGQRRAAAFGVFARQAIGQDSLMDVEMVVHVPAEHASVDGHSREAGAPLGSVVYVEGWGNLLTTTLPEFLKGANVTVRPVLDPNMISSPSGKEPTADQRRALMVRNPRSVFPFATTKAADCDVDHTVNFCPAGGGGATSMANMGPLDRRAHRAKTAGYWRLAQPEPGVFHWVSPLGYEYLVTGQGSVMTRLPDVPVAPIAEVPPQPPPEYEPPPDFVRAA